MKHNESHISAAQFKAHCLHLMDEVNAQHKALIITKHGKPIAKLVPFKQSAPTLFGAMAGSVKITGDITETGEEWEADAE